ncbi:kinase-like domain-containing protein [Schizophyllum amplum]|uniref:Kinase-like domain-containing protein n=1 Tax=Schizophyllum amplum TaxID=97359 RepID=A0A550CZP0_9AGAR|nr:kinase-like domain-containing protein [Auriculariopsis ampla]
MSLEKQRESFEPSLSTYRHPTQRTKSEEAISRDRLQDYFQERPKNRGVLTDAERFWVELQPWLRQRGYALRPRYQPGWRPSWRGTKKRASDCEDGEPIGYPFMLDATRISDGRVVMLKCISKTLHPHEAAISALLSSPPLRLDPANHCVPVYDVLHPPGHEGFVIIVMAFCRQFDNPRFDTVGEAAEFFRQVFEGLQFMHRNGVAHRDCIDLNIMMDASPLYDQPYHPRRTDWRRDFKGKAKAHTRTERPVVYYLIDFGLSRRYDLPYERPLEEPILGGDKSVPEFQNSAAPCDPFPTDVYYLGNMIRRTFLEGCEYNSRKRGVEFMAPLAADMVHADPAKRPTMDKVVERYNAILTGLSTGKLRSRLKKSGDSAPHAVYLSLVHCRRRLGFMLRGVPALPKPTAMEVY